MTWEEKTDRDYRGSPARNSDRDSAPGAIDELPNALGYSQLIRMNKRGPVTIRGVAAKVGLSTYTVSLALRGDRRVPAATQARVKATAEAMGYRTNPLVSANMERVRRSRWSKGTGATIGLVYESRADGVLWCTDQDLIAGVRRKAEELGFGCDEFDLGKARYRPGSVLARALGDGGVALVGDAGGPPLRAGGFSDVVSGEPTGGDFDDRRSSGAVVLASRDNSAKRGGVGGAGLGDTLFWRTRGGDGPAHGNAGRGGSGTGGAQVVGEPIRSTRVAADNGVARSVAGR